MVPFYKYQGTGNDFVILDGFARSYNLNSDDIRRMCDRRFGIGADGLIIIQNGESTAYKMLYFNADGNLGSMCGNGARCAFHLAHKLGYTGAEARFEAYDGIHTAALTESGTIRISMKDVSAIRQYNGDLVLDTGSPHYVRFVNDVESVDVRSMGSAIRTSPEFKQDGINVNFVEIRDDHLRIRTFERGVEDVTLSCGTGATACAVAYDYKYGQHSKKIHLRADGGNLSVYLQRENDRYSQVYLEGTAEPVFEGKYPLDTGE